MFLKYTNSGLMIKNETEGLKYCLSMRLHEAEMQGELDTEEKFLVVSTQGCTELYPSESKREDRHARKAWPLCRVASAWSCGMRALKIELGNLNFNPDFLII